MVTLATLDEIRDRIVSTMDPESIVLFGSPARGDGSESSDTDLLIVQRSSARPADRRAAAERALADRVMPLDLFVYTPEEMRSLCALGSPFIHDNVETGRVLSMRNATGVWLEETEEVLDAARILRDHGTLRGACLHSQRYVEKCPKALILERGEKPERTGDLIALRARTVRLSSPIALSTDDAVFLNGAYKGRYPSEEGLLPLGEPTAEDAARAVEVAGRVPNQTRGALGSA